MIAGGAAALVAAGVAVVLVLGSTGAAPVAAVGPVAKPAVDVLVPGIADAPLPTEAGLAAALRGPLGQTNLGSHVTVEVADMATGKVLFGKDAAGPTTPASTMKVATTLAVLETRGPNYRITDAGRGRCAAGRGGDRRRG